MESAPLGPASSVGGNTIINNQKNNQNNQNNNDVVSSTVPALQTTLEQLFSTRSLKFTSEDGVPVAVIAVQRYLSDKTLSSSDADADHHHDHSHPHHHQRHPHQDSYRYDLTVTDGAWRTRCVLHRGLNHLVRRGELRAGTQLRITACSFVYSEQRLGHGYICVERVRCGAAAGGARSPVLDGLKDLDCLSVLTRDGMENVGLRDDFPLKLSSKHYLPLWNNDDPEGEQWLPQRATPDLPLDVSRIILLCDLEASLGNTWGCLPLLVRVIHKSRLRYYGKCDITDVKKKVDYPYMAYFEVADQSGAMSLVLWNELCLDWYHSLHVGAVLYLQNYSVRDSYPSRSRPQMDHHRLRIFRSTEISLNRRNAVSVLTVVPQKNLPVQRGLPDVAYKFTCRSELKSLADNTACDVIGLVTFVGRVQRIRCPYDKGPEKFWTYRWVHALDGSSHRPFILEIFSSSQPDVFHSICPMTYLVCTQMRVCRGQRSSAPFLTSSCETEIYITGCHRGQPYVCDPRVKDFIQWTKTLKDGAILEKTAMGGHYCYPPAPPVFTQPMESGSVQVALVAAGDLQREVQSLQYREHKRLAIQGFITAVRYVERPHDTEPSTGEAQVAGAASSGTSEALAERTASDHRDNGTSGGQTAPAGGATSPVTRTTVPKKRSLQRSYMTRAKMRKRLAGVSTTPVRPQDSSSESESESESETSAMGSTSQEGLVESNHDPAELSQLLRWESSDWSRQRQELSTHLFGDRLHQDSLTRKFSFEDRSALLRWSGLPPSHWTPDQPSETLPPVACSGYYHITILGINQQVAVDAAFCPVMSSEDPRAKGLPLDPHGNSLLSCLSTGFLCPLGDPAPADLHINLPSPEEIFQTVGELEGTHLVCLLDLCHLGGDRVEILLNKVYQVT